MKTISRVSGSQNDKLGRERMRIVAALAVAMGLVAGVRASDVTATDVAGAFIWNVMDGSVYASGDWGVPENWLINDGTGPAGLPTETDSIWLKGGGVYTIRMGDDRTIKNLYFGCPLSGSPTATLDMNGKTLSVLGNVRGGWAQQYPYLIVTNGTMSVAGSITIAFDSNLSSPFGYFYVNGPDTVVTAASYRWGMKNNGQDAFRVCGGASFSTTATTAGFEALAGNGSGNYTVYRFADEGTTASIGGGLSSGSNVKVFIEKGANVTLSGYFRSSSDSYPSAVGGFANNSLMFVDDATLNADDGLVIGYEVGTSGRTYDNKLTCSGTGRVNLKGSLTVGKAGVGTSTGNVLEIKDGGNVDVQNLSYCGYDGAKKNKIRVENGTFTSSGLCLSYGTRSPTDNWLEVAGTNSLVTLNVCTISVSMIVNYCIAVTAGNGLRFVLPPEGYVRPPVNITGNTKVDDGALLEVQDLEGFAMRHPDTDVVLITAYPSETNRNALQKLANGFSARTTSSRYAGTVRVVKDSASARLIYRTPEKSGLVLLFR